MQLRLPSVLLVLALLTVAPHALASKAYTDSLASEMAYTDSLLRSQFSILEGLHTWRDLHRQLPNLIDDGAIAEGISDFVVRRLAAHWESFPELAELALADTAFGTRVVQHIDATTDPRDLAMIVWHASLRGSRRFDPLRKRVLESARAAHAATSQP
jgi:hypothetical protein